jgi:hypothetical protein
MRAQRLDSQRGNALIFVVTIGLVITIAFALFMSSTVVVEDRAVETELAKSRVYWAEMGDYNYALSRISFSRLCDSCTLNSNKDTDLAVVLQAYFNELNNNKTWNYADESAAYNFQTAMVAAADNRPGRQNYSGYLMATPAYTPSSLLAASSGKLPLMELRLCVGLGGSGGKCGNLNNNNGGKATAYYSINRLTNLPSP